MNNFSQNMKPTIGMKYSICIINLKPWKGKVSHIAFTIDLDKSISNQVKDKINFLKEKGNHKRRTIVGYTINLNEKL